MVIGAWTDSHHGLRFNGMRLIQHWCFLPVHTGYITFKFGVRVAYECHTPTRDCDHSGGALNKDDALCEIEQDVLFLDIGSDGQVWVSS